MISSTIYFENGINVAEIIADMQNLPTIIEPISFTGDEGKIIKKNLLSNAKLFDDFRKKNSLGFFLYSQGKTFFDISTPRTGYTTITMYLAEKLPSEIIALFCKILFKYKPVFGFACAEEEYKHRNRYYMTIGNNHIEDWIGRKLEKYIPGLYWYTLLSNDLLKRHGVNLSDISHEAVHAETSEDRTLHLLTFFEKPEDWQQNMQRLDDLCEKTDGVFSRRSVENEVAGVTEYQRYSDVISNWR